MVAILTKMQALIKYLNYHQDLYDKGVPIISDKEWDDAYFRLQQIESEYPKLIQSDSPTQKIHYVIKTKLEKVQHEYQPMLSLAKTKDIEEVKSFVGNKAWIAMLKLDGLTCRLTYENGKLVRAETRGNGIMGEDITHNAMVMPSIPKTIDVTNTIVIDGEVICKLENFKEFSNEYANARNFAAGSIRLLDSEESSKRNLTFVAWDVIKGLDSFYLSNKLNWLTFRNFTVVPYVVTDASRTIEDAINALKEGNAHSINEYPIDGIVFKYDDTMEYEAAGRTDHHFRGGLAYKFYDDEYETELLNIEWSMGRTGILTPVAIYKDVEIDGTICNRASLHNISIMTELLGERPYAGQKIWIYRSNMIIPQISRAEKYEKIAEQF